MRRPSACSTAAILASVGTAVLCGGGCVDKPPPCAGGAMAALGDGGCGAGGLAAGECTVTIDHGGAEREYVVHIPPGYDGRRPVPMVLDIHGLTSNDNQQAGLSGWRDKADREGFIVVYPNGLDASWNGGSLCCGASLLAQVDDEGFIRAVVARMKADACVDDKRVYATGLSNGGAMSHLLACRTADVFAATVPVSMGNGTNPCTPSRPISVVMFRGTLDTLVPYGGGLFPSAQADLDQWKGLDGCTGTPVASHGLCQTYDHCSGGVEVTLCTIVGGHVLYSDAATQGAAVADVAWETFQRQSLP